MYCTHSAWTRVSKSDGETTVQVTDSPSRALAASGDDEHPSFILLVGSHRKSEALQSLGLTSYKYPLRHGEIHLRKAPGNTYKWPLLVAESSIPNDYILRRAWRPSNCHEIMNITLDLDLTGVRQVSSHLHRHLVLPFADVICLFVDDIGGMDITARRLCEWFRLGRSSTRQTLPHLLLITEENIKKGDMQRFEESVKALAGIDTRACFTTIRGLSLSTWWDLRHSRSRKLRHWSRFVQELYSLLSLAREARALTKTMYSATHLNFFLVEAAQRLKYLNTFDFVKATRVHNPVSKEISNHLTNFLKHISTFYQLKSFAIPILASSLIVDHYAPNMHLSSPSTVFRTLYRHTCLRVSRAIRLDGDILLLPTAFSNLVERHFIYYFEIFYLSDLTPEKSHRQVLRTYSKQWKGLRSDETCYSCLRQRPMYRLPCGHSICQECIKRSGNWIGNKASLDRCLLCEQNTNNFRIGIKPDTATIRILSLDGGGTRARIPLGFLQEIQEEVGLPYPVQENFDMIFGTSSGAISACVLCINGWPVEECVASTEALSKIVFQPRQVSQLPLAWLSPMQGLWRLVLSVLFDSRYSAERLEDMLKGIFGCERGFMDRSIATENGQYIGMPITTTNDASTYLVTNYNGAVSANCKDKDYRLLSPSDGVNDIPLWKLLRAATAAPFYFIPMYLNNFGYAQDGGLTYNNPAIIAIQETADLFPLTPKPSIVVSLSTGSKRSSSSPDTTRRILGDTFVPRILRAFMRGDSQRIWKQFVSTQQNQEDCEFFRFDIEFEDNQPGLDSVENIESLGRTARESIVGSRELKRLAYCIRAQLFYFELDGLPKFRNGAYECSGRLLCRLSESIGYDALMTRLNGAATFTIAEKTIPAVCIGKSFYKRVHFRMPTRNSPFSIKLLHESEECHISGSPFTIDWLVKAQKLDACFGTSDYRKRKAVDDLSPSKRLKI